MDNSEVKEIKFADRFMIATVFIKDYELYELIYHFSKKTSQYEFFRAEGLGKIYYGYQELDKKFENAIVRMGEVLTNTRNAYMASLL